MNAPWAEWTKRFAALSQRERGLVFAAVVVVLILGSEALFIDPLWAKRSRLAKDLQAQRAEVATLEQVDKILANGGSAPNPADQAQLRALEGQLAEQEAQLGQFQAGLVPPQAMPSVLETLLARHHRLKLVALQTLPAEVVGETPAEPESQPAAAPGGNPAPFAGNLYRHGLELRVSGSYADLGAYVAALERLRPRLLWSGLELDATRHPKVELKLKLYTLSLEKAWLAL